MNEPLIALILVLGAYLVGSIPTSLVVTKLVGNVDLRDVGTRNIGISNLTNQIGAWWAVPVVPFDIVVKGTIPVLLASDKMLDLGVGVEAAAGLAGIIGHNWSIFVRLQGGRGMATVLGATGALSFPLLIVYGAVASLGVLFSPWKDSAVWWLIAVLMMPVWAVLLNLPLGAIGFCIGFIVVTVLKRMTSNSIRNADGQISAELLRNRVLFDRDIRDRQEWIDQQAGT
jgi:glycerol-3-phosphate acyltransferase PlsY